MQSAGRVASQPRQTICYREFPNRSGLGPPCENIERIMNERVQPAPDRLQRAGADCRCRFSLYLDAAAAAFCRAAILLLDAAVAMAFAKVMNSVTSLAKMARFAGAVAPALIFA